MDDEIIYSWFFDSIEFFDSTASVAIIFLVENLESFSSLRSQQIPHRLIVGALWRKSSMN